MSKMPSSGRAPGISGAPGDFGLPQASLFRRFALAVILLVLLAVPLLLLTAAVSIGSPIHRILAQHTAFWFPLWAVFAVWVALDASALYGFAGPRPDPLGGKALCLSAVGIANIVSMFLFLILTKGT
jgi:hypothetical protein